MRFLHRVFGSKSVPHRFLPMHALVSCLLLSPFHTVHCITNVIVLPLLLHSELIQTYKDFFLEDVNATAQAIIE